MRKTRLILSALSNATPSQSSPATNTYYALDLEKRELERTLDELTASSVGLEMQGKVDSYGLWGTYEGGFKFVEEGGLRRRGAVAVSPRCQLCVVC